MKRFNQTNLNRQQRYWVVVFVANLIVPLPFGLTCTEGIARMGMCAAIGLLWFLGYEAVRKIPRMGFVLNSGGSIVALSQIWPLLQFTSGFLSLSVGESVALVSRDMKIASAIGGLLVTLLTGGTLMAIAWMLGLVVRGWAEFVNPRVSAKEGLDF